MRVVIAEAQFIGHYYTYVRRVLEAVRELTNEVTLLVSPEGLKSNEFATNIAPILSSEKVVDSLQMPRTGRLRGPMDMVRMVRTVAKSTKADFLLFPSADNVAQAVGLAGLTGYRSFSRRIQSEGLLTKLSFVYPNAERTIPYQLIIAGLKRSTWSRLHTIDLLAYQWLRNRAPSLAKRFSIIPDPVEDFALISKLGARKLLGIPEDGRYLALPGILIYRKGVGLLLEAFLAAKVNSSDRVLLAGPVGKDVAETLKDSRFASLVKQDRIVVLDKYLNAEELGQVFCAGDVTVCPYPNQWHPSSIAIKSVACNRPVLGADSYWLGKMIPAFNMGWTVSVKDHIRFSKMLETVLDQASSWQRNEDIEDLVRFQSIETFKNCWTKGIRERLGMRSAENQEEISNLIARVGLSDFGVAE